MGEAARSTRDGYRDALLDVLHAEPRAFCLDSDTGLFTGVDFGPASDRYINAGIAEQNLMGMAAGLAASGKLPYVTTMATFATTRALEAIKIDIAYNGLPVRIAGTHAGLAAGHLGPTHHALEDLAVMCGLPGFTVVVPADAGQAALAVAQTAGLRGPVYLRLGKAATPALHEATSELPPFEAGPFEVGGAQKLRGGEDLAIVACGPHPVHAALGAAQRLAGEGISAAVLNLHTLRPLDLAALIEVTEPVAAVITVEEHWRHGGLGSIVAAALAEHAPTRVASIGMPDTFAEGAAPQEDLLRAYGISDAQIVAAAFDLVAGAGRGSPCRPGNGGGSNDPDLSRV